MSITLDPCAPGRQFGELSVSLDNAPGAWASTHASRRHPDAVRLAIPIAVIGQGAGPVVTVVADATAPQALHAIWNLMRTLEAQHIRGRVQLVPTLCPGTLAGCASGQSGAVDDVGSAALAGAGLDALEQHLLVHSTLVLHLRGEAGARWCDVAVVEASGAFGSPAPGAERALIAFGAPFSLRRRSDAPSGSSDRSDGTASPDHGLDIDLSAATGGGSAPPAPPAGDRWRQTLGARCRARGIDLLSVHGHRSAEAGRATDRLRTGVRNVLIDAGVLDAPFELRATQTLRLPHPAGPLRAPSGGWLEQRARPGASVHRGEVLALIHDPSRPHLAPVPVAVPQDGVLLSARREGPTYRGDRLAVLAEPMPV